MNHHACFRAIAATLAAALLSAGNTVAAFEIASEDGFAKAGAREDIPELSATLNNLSQALYKRNSTEAIDIVDALMTKSSQVTDPNTSAVERASIKEGMEELLLFFTERCPDIDSREESGAWLQAIYALLDPHIEDLDMWVMAPPLRSFIAGFEELEAPFNHLIWCQGIGALYLAMVKYEYLILDTPSDLKAADGSETLHSFLWEMGIVDRGYRNRSLRAGFDPKADFITLKKAEDWMAHPPFRGRVYTSINLPIWSLLDATGYASRGASLDIACDNNDLYLDSITAYDLSGEEGEVGVQWSFDGEPFQGGMWPYSKIYIAIPDDFDHRSFIRRILTARYLVFKLTGKRHNFKSNLAANVMRVGFALIPIDLTGDKEPVAHVLRACQD